jgi:serine/threonine protein kinase
MFDASQVPQPWISMELIHGSDLRGLLSRGRLSQPAAVAVAAQVCSALTACHRAGVLHRDVKPANIMARGSQLPEEIGGPSQVILTDFGVAKMMFGTHTSLTRSGSAVGTLQYMSPEQIRDRALTPRSDISIRLALYCMRC